MDVVTIVRVQCGSSVIHFAFTSLLVRSMSTAKQRHVEDLWRDLVSNTSQWWDHRPEKINQKFPDFKHKQTGEALWLDDVRKPPWVQSELAAMPPGTLQSNAFVWSQRLKRYAKARQYMKTIEVFRQMQQERICPDIKTFLPVLNACAALGALEEGKRVHTQILQVGCDSDVYVATCLVNMYAKCGSITDAWSVFNKMGEQDVVSWNAMIGGFVKSGLGLKAIGLFREMQREGVEPNAITFVGVLNACASVTALEEGRHVHEQIIRTGCESHVYVAACLVDMYAKCGSIKDAWDVFNKMLERDVVSWSVMIGGYVKSGQGLKAIEIFRKMQQEGLEPDRVTFVGVLNACASIPALEDGRCVHQQIIQRGWESDVYISSCLVDMYAKCGSIEDAWCVFDKMSEQNVVSWSAIIGGFAKSGQGLKAMELFRQMQQEGVEPNAVTFVGVLNACASVAALEEGRLVHKQISQRGLESDVYLTACLVDMYAKCGSIEDALTVFNKMREHVVCWNAMIGGYVKSGQWLKAMELFSKMQEEGVEPDVVTFVRVLNACACVAALEDGKHVHEQIIRRGYESDVYAATCLVDMYAKCGSIEDACHVFKKMREHNVVSWSAMIGGYVKSGQGLKAMELFWDMQLEGVEPNAVTFVGMLNACASVAALEEGRRVHVMIIENGYEGNDYVTNSLVDMYAKCGSIEDARNVFSKMLKCNVVSWSAMIGGYAMSGQGVKAIELFWEMQQEGVEPDAVTFVEVLNSCASVAALDEGRRVHEQIIQRGYETDICVANCLVDMYAKCGSIEDAWSIFNKMQEHDVVSWSAMIGGYAMHGHATKAIELFKRMRKEGVEINEITITSLLSACSHGGLVKEGLRFFNSITLSCNVLPTSKHYACIVDLLGRAGRLEEAGEIAERIPMEGDAWMALLGACRIHSNIEMAERAAKRLFELDPENDSAHILMSNIYAAAGKWDSSAAVDVVERFARKLWKDPGRSWIEVNNMVHSFMIDDKEHPEILEINAELEKLSMRMNEAGYIPSKRFVLHEAKQAFYLCHHSEKLAIVYGLMRTPPGTPLRIKKNTWVCPECHSATKFISKLVGRVITVKDVNSFHCFEDGICSCKYW